MKSGKRHIKKTIKKRIELSRMGVRDKYMITPRRPKPVAVDLVSRNSLRRGKQPPRQIPPPPSYQKKTFVDYDVVICIPSYNRYEKVKRLLSQFHEQPTKYSFKIILLNDGSDNQEYDKLIEEFPEIIYLKNDVGNGRVNHWYCYSQMWENLKEIRCHAVLQMDDDFIICDNFLDTIIDMFFDLKEKNRRMMAIAPHLWWNEKEYKLDTWWNQNPHFIDGIGLIDDVIIKSMNYEMKPVDPEEIEKKGTVCTWVQIGDTIRNSGGIVQQTSNSLVYHDGNADSKLHSVHRNSSEIGGVHSQRLVESLKKYHD